MAPRKRLRVPPLEKQEHEFIRKLYTSAGCTVINFAQAQRAQQTAGIPDMLVFDLRGRTFWWHEVKRLQGEGYRKMSHGQTGDQLAFQVLVESFGQEYLLGARDVAEAKLRSMGRLL